MSNGSGITPTSSANNSAGKSAGQVVVLLSVPELLQKNLRALRVQGEVVGQNNDGSTRIKTPQGDIDISTRQKPLPVGTKIDIDIPAGSPPRNATIRPSPVTLAQPQQNITPNQNQGAPKETIISQNINIDGTKQQPVDNKPTQTPLSTQYQPVKNNSQPLTPQPLPTIATGQTVRLTPLPLALNQTITPQPTQTTAPNSAQPQPPSVPPSPDILVKLPSQVIQNTSEQIIKTALPSDGITTPKTTPQPQSVELKITTPQIAVIRTNDTPINSAPKNNAPVTPSAQTTAILPTTQKGADIPQPSPLSTPIISKLLQGFDGKILDIKPPVLIPTVSIAPKPDAAVISPPPQQSVSKTIPQTPVDITQPQAPIITAKVIGFTPQNLPVLSIQLANTTIPQNFILQFPATNIQAGSQISLSPQVSVSNIAAPANGAQPSLQTLLKPLPFWPVFDEIFQTLNQLSPHSAQILSRALPSPTNGGGMGAAALLFIAAMRSGDISGWLNDKKLEILTKAGKENLIRNLTQETTTATAPKPDAPSSEWRSYPLPMLWQNEISKIMLHIKHNGEDNKNNNKDGTTRFVMDVSLTRMGDVQLDGLLSGNRLDIIVRTQMPISTPMQDGMKRAYADAMENTHIYGELGFQGDIKSWMNVITREENILSTA